MVIPKEEKDDYGIEDVGIYAPTDLVIRSSEAINLENVNAQSTLDFCFLDGSPLLFSNTRPFNHFKSFICNNSVT